MKRKFAPVMITAAALITTVPTTQVFASEGINAETATDNITPLVIDNNQEVENTQDTSNVPQETAPAEVAQETVNVQEVENSNDQVTIPANESTTNDSTDVSKKAETSNVQAESKKTAVQTAGEKLATPSNIKWDGKVLSWDAVKGSNQLTLSDGTTFPVQVRYQITVKSTDGEDDLYAFGDTEGTTYDFGDALENDIPANAKFCFAIMAYYDSEDIPNGSIDQMNEAYAAMENLAAEEATTGEYQNVSSKPDTPKKVEVTSASITGAVLTASKGKNPAYDAVSDTEGTKVIRESWTCEDDGKEYDSDSSEKFEFEGGKTYSYSVTIAAEDGYYFGNGITGTVNGNEAVVVHNVDGTITLKGISTVTIPADVVSKKIETVKAENATLTAKAGDMPKFTATVPNGEDRYEIAYESWTDGTNTVRSDSDSDFKFEAGKTYTYSIAFRLTEKGAAEGYHMNGSTLSLNGNNAGVSISETGTTAEFLHAASIDIPKPDTGKTDTDKKDDEKPDTGKGDSDKSDTDKKDDSGKTDTDKKDDSKPDTDKNNTNKKDETTADTGRIDSDKKNEATADIVKDDSGKDISGKTNDTKQNTSDVNAGQNISDKQKNESTSNSVKTGDPAVWGLWASLFGSSGIAGAVIRRRKRK